MTNEFEAQNLKRENIRLHLNHKCHDPLRGIKLLPLLKILLVKLLAVVYFDQHLGAAHAKRWLK